MKTSEYLYESVKPIWDSYCDHPFVKGIGDGTLDISKFRFYLIQDYLYLLDYAKVFALGVVKANDEKTMQAFSILVHDILNGEMSIHRSYMKRLGITEDEVQNSTPSLANTSYTNYMLSVASTGTLADLSVSILSCAWSYELIGKELAKLPSATENELYGEWVTGYSSPEYSETTKWCIDLVDELCKNASHTELERLKEIFVNCSRYEYLFWDMAYKKEL